MTRPRRPFEGALPPTMSADAAGARGGLALAVAPPEPSAAARERDRPPRLLRLRTWATLTLVVGAVVVGLAVRAVLAPVGSSASGVDASRAAPDELPAGRTAYGQAFTYADGLRIEVAPPRPFTPSATATGGEAGAATLFEVTITNDTEETYRASTLEVTATSGGVEAPPVWDPDQGVELSGPAFAVPPGGAVQFRVGFALAQPEDVHLTVVPALYGYGPLVVGTM